MSHEITIHRAVAADKTFLAEAITEAEKSGGLTPAYCALFALGEEEFKNILLQILDEDMGGQELCISGFLIARVNGENAGAICSWIEQADGNASSMIKSNLLMHFIGKEKFIAAIPKIRLLEQVGIERSKGAIQLESIYTVAACRGMGISRMLINAHIDQHLKATPAVSLAQITLVNTNKAAVKAYEKAGFTTVLEKTSPDANLLQILPGNGKILMEKKLTTI